MGLAEQNSTNQLCSVCTVKETWPGLGRSAMFSELVACQNKLLAFIPFLRYMQAIGLNIYVNYTVFVQAEIFLSTYVPF